MIEEEEEFEMNEEIQVEHMMRKCNGGDDDDGCIITINNNQFGVQFGGKPMMYLQ